MKRMLRYLLAAVLAAVTLTACGAERNSADSAASAQQSVAWDELDETGTMPIEYAKQFSVTYYTGGYALVSIQETGDYLVVPENEPVPDGLPEDVVVLQQPLDHIYLVSTSVMDLFQELDSVDAVTLSGTDADGWYIEEAAQAIESGDMLFAGKYSAPDYELILNNGCDLAVENTMILHSPEVKEKLESLGIPVLVERSSYESDPLGRMEWLKLYGVLLGKEEEAARLYEQELDNLSDVLEADATGKTVAFFYITNNGAANVRKSGDYVVKMIEMAGGEYIFPDLEDDNALSTMNMDMETFYAEAKDADYIIYNSTIDGELTSVEQLLDKSHLLKEFKAVQEGNVWCTEQSLFQESMGLGDMIRDIHTILTEENPEAGELTYLHRLSGAEE
ncbi:MAG: ABC transporter substrate-binding protein [Butyricicoccus sp.]